MDEWTLKRIAFIRGLNKPTEQQLKLMALVDSTDRTEFEDKKLTALVKAEKAADRFQKAKADADKLLQSAQAAERKARNHELFKAAGLLIMSGLVDTKTGKLTRDTGELLGALLSLAESEVDSFKRDSWKRKGDAAIAVAGEVKHAKLVRNQVCTND